MSWATIYLRRQLPAASSNRPEGQAVRTEPSLCLVLLPVGFTWPARLHEPPVRSYRTISPLTPETRGSHLKGEPLGQFTFCCTCPILADGGSYPPPCPMEPGLSSLAASHQRDRLVHFSQFQFYRRSRQKRLSDVHVNSLTDDWVNWINAFGRQQPLGIFPIS